MLKFVKNWIREAKEQDTIERDGTADKWTKCDEGLPDSDRRVEVMLFGVKCYTDQDVMTKLSYAKFNPHVGWELEDYKGVILAWRDMSKQTRDLLNDIDLIKRLNCK